MTVVQSSFPSLAEEMFGLCFPVYIPHIGRTPDGINHSVHRCHAWLFMSIRVTNISPWVLEPGENGDHKQPLYNVVFIRESNR